MCGAEGWEVKGLDVVWHGVGRHLETWLVNDVAAQRSSGGLREMYVCVCVWWAQVWDGWLLGGVPFRVGE